MGDCQNYGPFLGPYYSTGPNTGPNLGDPKRDHNFDNPPYVVDGHKQMSGTILNQRKESNVLPSWSLGDRNNSRHQLTRIQGFSLCIYSFKDLDFVILREVLVNRAYD